MIGEVMRASGAPMFKKMLKYLKWRQRYDNAAAD